MDLLDIMLTWDQLSNEGNTRVKSAQQKSEPSMESTSPSNLSALFSVEKGSVIISHGAEGYFYYLIESGVASVSKLKPNETTPTVVAKLTSGMSFGEEALKSIMEQYD